MSVPKYRTPVAFKTALEERVRRVAKEKGIAMDRQRQLVVFDRFLARLQREFGEEMVLKGALALWTRMPTGRGTRDLDALVRGDVEALLPRLQGAGRMDLGDYLSFSVELDPKHPEITGEGVVYGGRRYRVQAALGGKIYGGRFGVDLAVGPLVYGEAESLPAPENLLAFAEIPATTYRVYPRETHLAEKLHAYTLPRVTVNMRVKDLPDLGLLGKSGSFRGEALKAGIQAVFEHRGSHSVPESFPDPPGEWEEPYQALAAENSLAWPDLVSVTRVVREFLDPVLAGEEGIWDPEKWQWKPLGRGR